MNFHRALFEVLGVLVLKRKLAEKIEWKETGFIIFKKRVASILDYWIITIGGRIKPEMY